MRPAHELLLDEQHVKQLATTILARAEYARHREAAEWLRTVRDWLSSLDALRHAFPGLSFGLLCALGLLGVLLVAHIAWSIAIAMCVPQSVPPDSHAPAPRDFAAEAASLAQRGCYLEASHCMLLATLAHAAGNRLFELKPSDGNRVVRERLRGVALPAGIATRVGELIASTESHWFGRRHQDAALYAAWQSAYDDLRRTAR
jgi:hypothetical protein